MEKYHGPRTATAAEAQHAELPEQVQLAIDDLAGKMREGLLALSVGVGLKVMDELIEEELVLSIEGALARTLRSANAIESMLSISRERSRNVKRWRGGEMVLRWTAAGMLDAERSFRRVRGHKELAKLRAALRRHVLRVDREEVRDFPIAA